MKTKLAAILTAIAILSSVALAETNSVPLITDQALLKVIADKYNRDMRTKEGRKFWHGKVHESVDTNTLTKVSVYEDGTVFRDPAKITTPAMSAKVQFERLKVQTNGVPARLAAARLRQRQNAETVSNVTVRITAGGDQ